MKNYSLVLLLCTGYCFTCNADDVISIVAEMGFDYYNTEHVFYVREITSLKNISAPFVLNKKFKRYEIKT